MRPIVTIGVDVGGTKTSIVAVPTAGIVEWEVVDGGATEVSAMQPTSLARPPTPSTVAELIDVVSETVECAGATCDVVGVGLGLAGLVDLEGMVVRAPNTAFLEGHAPGRVLADRLGCPVTVDNDANVAAWAIRTIDEPDAAHITIVALGTGIGGGFVVDGGLVRGAHGFAAEPGHVVVVPDGVMCVCGQRGCWERYASGSALGRMTQEAYDDGRFGDALVLADGDTASGEQLTALMRAGNGAAQDIFDEFASWVALGIANLVTLFDPEVVVVCGGIAAEGDELIERVQRRLDVSSVAAGRRTRLRAATTGPETSAVGAALMARSDDSSGSGE